MTSTPARRRTGRRGGDADTRGDILAAARHAFSHRGYDGTTLRSVAQDAGVDVALISYYFGGKSQLFTAAMEVPISISDLIDEVFEPGLDGIGERFARRFLEVWEDPATGPAILSVFRSAASQSQATETLAQFISAEVLTRYVAHLPGADGARRAVLAASQLIGVAMLRHVLRIPPMRGMTVDEIVAIVAPTIQGYLTGPLPQPGRAVSHAATPVES